MPWLRLLPLAGLMAVLASAAPTTAQVKKKVDPDVGFPDMGFPNFGFLPPLEKPVLRPQPPAAVLAAEKALHDFNCGIHYEEPKYALRNGKRVLVAPGGHVDHVAFPDTTKDADLAKLIPHAARLPNLKSVDLGKNDNITEKGLKHLAKLTKLEALFLDHTPASAAWLKELANLKLLKWLDLSGTPLSDEEIKQIAGIPTLQSLVIRHMPKLTAEGMANVVAIPQVRYLNVTVEKNADQMTQAIAAGKNLNHLKIAPVGDAEAVHLGKMDALDTLDLSNPDRFKERFGRLDLGNKKVPIVEAEVFNRISDAGLNALGGMKALRVLDVAHTSVNGGSLDGFTKLKRLEELTLKGTSFSNTGAAKLSALPTLRVLDLRATSLTDAGMADLADLPIVERLLLAELPISDAGLRQLTRLRSLVLLDLSGTRVTAAVKDLRYLTQLEQLHLVSTSVTTASFSTLGQLKSLRILNLHDNCPEVSIDTVRKLQDELPNCAVLSSYCGMTVNASFMGQWVGWPGAVYYPFKMPELKTPTMPAYMPKVPDYMPPATVKLPPPPPPAPPAIRVPVGGGTGPRP